MAIAIGSRRLVVTLLALVGCLVLVGLRVVLSANHDPVTVIEAGMITGICTAYYGADTLVKRARAQAGMNPETGEKP